MRFEEALPLMRSRGDTIDLLVCDVNAPPAQVVGMVLGHALPMLAPGCPLVLTFKRTIPSKAAWERAMDEALAELATVADGVEVLHLLANTSRETTVVGWRRAKGPASR